MKTQQSVRLSAPPARGSCSSRSCRRAGRRRSSWLEALSDDSRTFPEQRRLALLSVLGLARPAWMFLEDIRRFWLDPEGLDPLSD